MKQSKRPIKKSDEVAMQDLYAVKVGAIWQQLKQEHLSFLALCAYFFFEYVRPQSIYPVIDVIPWTQLCLIAAIVFGTMVDKPGKWAPSAQNKLIICYSFVVILSSFMAFYPVESWLYLDFYYIWVIVYFLVVKIVNTEKRFFIFIILYLLWSYKMAQNGFTTWAERGFGFADWGLIGAPGFFRNSGEFAIQMLIFFPLAIAFVFSLRKYMSKYMRYFFYTMPFFGIMVVVGASSRGAQIGMAVMGVWFLLYVKRSIKTVIITAVVCSGVYYALPTEQMARFEGMGVDKTSMQRLAYFDYGVELTNDNPIIGIGYYNWLKYTRIMNPEGIGPMGIMELPHNSYIQVSSELGYLGLFVLLLMIIYSFVQNARSRRLARSHDNAFLVNTAYGLDAGMIGFLVACTFVTVMYYPFFWIQIAMSTALYSMLSQMAVKNVM